MRPLFRELLAEAEELRHGLQLGHDAVSVLTVHRSKGLEFDHVHVAGVQGDVFPHLHYALQDARLMEEDRRLFYVALTRTKCSVSLSNHARHIAGRIQGPERHGFINELPQGFIEEVKA